MIWVDREGKEHEIATMGDTHLRNAARMFLRVRERVVEESVNTLGRIASELSVLESHGGHDSDSMAGYYMEQELDLVVRDGTDYLNLGDAVVAEAKRRNLVL